MRFYELVECFPRVLVSTSYKTEWFTHQTSFQKTLEEDDSLRTRVQFKLKEIAHNDIDFDIDLY